MALYPRSKYGPCCVVPGCSFRSGTNGLSQIKTFRFPKDVSRQALWVQAIKRDQWQPKATSVICSRHFITGKPSDDSRHPDWIPTKFPLRYQGSNSEKQKMARYSRAKARDQKVEPFPKHIPEAICEADDVDDFSEDRSTKHTQTELTYEDCQVQTNMCDWKSYTTLENENIALKMEVTELKKKLKKAEDAEKALSILNSNLHNSLSSSLLVKRALETDQNVKFFTGFHNRELFFSTLDFLLSFWKPRTIVSLSYNEQFLLVLMRLRLGLLFEDLAHRFDIHTSQANSVFHEWLDVMAVNLRHLIKWPSRATVEKNMIPEFRDETFKNIRGIIDCSEIFIEKPSYLHARSQTYSRYKSHNTLKFLIVVSPMGGISFVSNCWGGRATDKEITKQSGLLDLVETDDVFLVDRGFNCSELFAVKNAKLLIPAFTKGKDQLGGSEVTISRKYSRVRIHVERAIQRVKTFRIFSRVLPISVLKKQSKDGMASVDKMLKVCTALTNLQSPIVRRKS